MKIRFLSDTNNSADSLEYNVSYTGSPLDGYPKWVRIDITNVQGTSITADLKVERLDGTSDTNSGTFDLQTGVPDLLLISAGLDVGDEFYHEDFGNNAISETEDKTYAEAKRTIVISTIDIIVLHWDKSTGILLQSDQSEDNFTQKMLADKTNMWEPQIFGLDSTIFYILIVAVIAVVAIIVLYLYRRKQ